MSEYWYLAADVPMEPLRNPHYKTLSVNAALALGMIVPDFLLAEGFDRDQPDVILWSDLDTMEDADDNIAVFPLHEGLDGVCTEKQYRMEIEWGNYTAGKADILLDYIRKAMETAEELELWRFYAGSCEKPFIKRRIFSSNEMTEKVLRELAEKTDIYEEPPVHYCYVIRK